MDNPHTWTPAQPGDTPGQVEPDDSRPKPIDAAGPLDEAIEAAWHACADEGWITKPDVERAVRAAAPVIAAPIQAERDRIKAQLLDALDKVDDLEGAEKITDAQIRALQGQLDRAKLGRADSDRLADMYQDQRDTAEAEAADLRARLATAEGERNEARDHTVLQGGALDRALERLATAERDALTRAADDAAKTGWSWLRVDAAHWLRERAKAAGGE